MKRFVFKKWFTYLLVGINLLAVLFMSADFEDMATFHLVHLVALTIFVINSMLLLKHSKEFI